MSRVGLVVVSHSARLAEGVVEVAAQMAPDVTAVAAGGTADGGIGTDFDAVGEALARADGGAGVVVLYDLGSARMVADLAVESLTDPEAAVVVVDAPLVEAAVAAAVAAQSGAGLTGVAGAAREAAASFGMPAAGGSGAGTSDAGAAERFGMPAAGRSGSGTSAAEPAAAAAEPATAAVSLTNEIGLHARPAALLARTLSEVDASVTVRFGDRSADGTSVLALMSLGARGGDVVDVSATGPQADEALRRVADLAARGFDE